MDQSAVEIQNLTVTKEGREVLRDITLAIGRGKVTGLIGPSGSGKTTLMRTIVGVQRATGGKVLVLGSEAGSRSLRSRIGYVTQSPAIYPDLTVIQNLRYFGSLVGATRQDSDIIISKVQLDDQRNQLAGSLSGGQKARVSLAIALLGGPELLVLDEPTVGLDPLLRAGLWDMFAGLALQGVSILVSSHVMDEAERCEDLILLREGKSLWNDSRTALLTAMVAEHVGEAFITAIRREESR